MSGEVKLTTRNALRVLRPGPFRRYIIGSAISDTGTWMQVMAQAWVMTTLTTSALMLGLVQLCAGLPMLALTMVGGSTADRFDKRKILLITQYVQIGTAVSIGLLIWSGKIAIWQIFIFAAIQGTSNSFEMPTLSALVPELVNKDEIQGAISLDRSVFHGSRMVGFSLSGILISAWGMAATAWNGGGRRKALQRNQGRFSLHRQRQTEPGHARADRDAIALHFPNHYGHDAALRPPHPPSRRGSSRIADGRFSGGFGCRFAFPNRTPAP
jgi:hypothetical protein